jgi:hypothetical protein
MTAYLQAKGRLTGNNAILHLNIKFPVLNTGLKQHFAGKIVYIYWVKTQT